MNQDQASTNSSANKDKVIAWLTLCTAIIISIVSAVFSVDGLIALFAATPWKAGIAATALEVGKIVAALWLHHNWGYKAPALKAYLILAVLALMALTSMGIFGTLSKSFMVHSLGSQDAYADVAYIDTQLESLNAAANTRRDQIAKLDKYVDVYLNSGNIDTARTGVRLASRQTENRKQLQADLDRITLEIRALTKEKLEKSKSFSKVESEVGPVIYIAELFYGEKSQAVVEKAVRAVILLIVLCFDPLAILLLIAAQISFAKIRENNTQPVVYKTDQVDYNDSPVLEDTEISSVPAQFVPGTTEIVSNSEDIRDLISDPEVQASEISDIHSDKLARYKKKLEDKVNRLTREK